MKNPTSTRLRRENWGTKKKESRESRRLGGSDVGGVCVLLGIRRLREVVARRRPRPRVQGGLRHGQVAARAPQEVERVGVTLRPLLYQGLGGAVPFL